MFTIATLLHLFMIWKQKMPTFALVAVWALIAIAVANKELNATVYFAAWIAAIVLFANVLFRWFKRNTVS